MYIKSVSLRNFRNYENLELEFDPDTNILYGDNAQGKTNILESLYMSGTSRSLRGSRDREIIRFGEEEAHIRTEVMKRGSKYAVDIHLKKNRSKGIAVNRVPIRKASELFGILYLVLFSPEDLNIIKSGPSERRRFLDQELCQIDKIYFYNLSCYQKTLMQRNRLLKDMYFQPELERTLSAWDEQLVRYGTKVIERRRNFLEDLSGIVSETHKNISGGKEELLTGYEPDTEEDSFAEELQRASEKDRRFCTTSVGPHRDDIRFSVNGIDIRKYGSQGQQRTAALSLKLSEIEIVKERIHDTPVLLLDDVLSELDAGRQSDLLESIHGVQTIITCTGLEEFVRNRFQADCIFRVKGGTAEKMGKEKKDESGNFEEMLSSAE